MLLLQTASDSVITLTPPKKGAVKALPLCCFSPAQPISQLFGLRSQALGEEGGRRWGSDLREKRPTTSRLRSRNHHHQVGEPFLGGLGKGMDLAMLQLAPVGRRTPTEPLSVYPYQASSVRPCQTLVPEPLLCESPLLDGQLAAKLLLRFILFIIVDMEHPREAFLLELRPTGALRGPLYRKNFMWSLIAT
ncbi:hypothetical protein LMH87_003048 [Akanthomyces muscarius]|uniref:Uncharacterized protein n=1 Tax=Akanthomyces muscarius TaxID=2231603 RepID=A0A9W8UK29_AKAMU|nr:hypothetical protein LMH87_003048 [Akanthomyces muscarius]KAJ4148584.1 hypothetical protein LMH87_003048 [Akanthomyces muscarius]